MLLAIKLEPAAVSFFFFFFSENLQDLMDEICGSHETYETYAAYSSFVGDANN